mgnify:CR=1 FL=1
MKKEFVNTKKAIIFGVKPHWDLSPLPASILSKYLNDNSYEVTYISDDLSIFHFLKWKINISLLKNFINNIFFEKKINGVTHLSSFSLFPHFSNINRIYTFLYTHFNFRFKSKKIKRYFDLSYDLVFCASYRNYEDFIKIKTKRKIFSIEDNPKGFGILSSSLINKADKTIKTQKEIEVWCTSKVLIRDYYNSANYYSNGINENFNVDLRFNTNKKCVYVGALEDWFDWDLVNIVFNKLGKKYGFTLDIFGHANKNIENYIKSDFIEYKGTIPNNLVQNTLQKYSVGIIPFKKDDLIKYVNPIKYYEYLSSGIRTVATDWEELVELKYDYIYLARQDNFADAIIKANQTTFKGHEAKIKNFINKKNYKSIFKNVFKF